MNRWVRLWSAVGGLLMATAGPALGGPGLEQLARFSEQVKTFQADFKQTVVDADGQVVEEGWGHMLLKRPGRFRWIYESPYKQLIVADGERIWIYDQDLEQVTVKPLGKALGDTPAQLLTTEQPLEESFQVTEGGRHDGLVWVVLQPKSEDVSFERVRLGFDDNNLRLMRLEDNFGQVTQLRFNEVQGNAPIADQRFDFTPPAGVDVIGEPKS